MRVRRQQKVKVMRTEATKAAGEASGTPQKVKTEWGGNPQSQGWLRGRASSTRNEGVSWKPERAQGITVWMEAW